MAVKNYWTLAVGKNKKGGNTFVARFEHGKMVYSVFYDERYTDGELKSHTVLKEMESKKVLYERKTAIAIGKHEIAENGKIDDELLEALGEVVGMAYKEANETKF